MSPRHHCYANSTTTNGDTTNQSQNESEVIVEDLNNDVTTNKGANQKNVDNGTQNEAVYQQQHLDPSAQRQQHQEHEPVSLSPSNSSSSAAAATSTALSVSFVEAPAQSVAEIKQGNGPRGSKQNKVDADCNSTAGSDARIEKETINDYIPHYLKRFMHPAGNSNNDNDTDFCMTTHVKSTKLIAQCMMEGFLPMAYNDYILLPKLHTIRSIIPLRNTIPIVTMTQMIHPNSQFNQQQSLHISKNTRKRAKHYYMTINTAFDTVVQHCQQQHNDGEDTHHCWLYPNLLHIFRKIHTATIQNRDGYTAITYPQQECVPIRLYSIEVWNCDTHEFAAGEIGYTAGNTIYTSLSGCCAEDNAGTVQLAAFGALLLYLKTFQCWDLGMDMPYKQSLGAQLVARRQFVSLIHALRTMTHQSQPTAISTEVTPPEQDGTRISSSLSSIVWPIQQLVKPINCREMIDAISRDNHCNNNDNGTKNQTHKDDTTAVVRLNKKQRKALKKRAMEATAEVNIAANCNEKLLNG